MDGRAQPGRLHIGMDLCSSIHACVGRRSASAMYAGPCRVASSAIHDSDNENVYDESITINVTLTFDLLPLTVE